MPSYPTQGGPFLAKGDFNNDGRLDLVVGNRIEAAGSYGIYLGNGDGSFNPLAAVATTGQMFAIETADVNGDGRLDLITSTSVYLGNGNGTFGGAIPLTVAGTGLALEVVVGDINGDGRADLAVTSSVSNRQTQPTLPVLLGNGDGRSYSFSA